MADRDSDMSQIAVNANNIPDDSVDCGVRLFGWCRGPNCQKYARLRTFVIVLATAGLIQGACETYFRVSAKEAALENSYNPLIVDWLLVSSGIFQAVFALTVAYWAHKLHPISWLGGIIMLQSAACIIAVIPSIINFSDGVVPTVPSTDASLCTTSLAQLQRSTLSTNQSHILTLIMLFVLQLMLGLGSLAYYTIGITYIDDNSQSIDSPAVIATALAAKMFGLQLGSMIILSVGVASLGWWLGWVILGPLVFISGVLLGLFPKKLPKTVIHQAAQRIIEESRSRNFGSQLSTYIDDSDFGPSMKRLFSNKLLMFNIMGTMFIQAAAINYMLQEESYLQSRFYLPYNEEDGLEQEWKARFVSYFLRPPITAAAMLIGGLVIAKLKLTGRTIASINIGLGVKLLAVYIGYIFIKCDVGPIAGISGGKLGQPFCSRQCLCAPTSFVPVCPENTTVTYFSPCYAGCSLKSSINNVDLYEQCTCGTDYESSSWSNVRATAGACSADTCSQMLIMFQIMSLSAAVMLGMSIVGKIIITLRCILPQDKAMALGFEVTTVGLFTYVPAKLAYDVVTRVSCVYWAPDYARCLLRETPKHGNIINILSASLTLLGILFDVLVYIYAKGLNIYNCKVTDLNYTPSLYALIPNEDREHATATVGGGSPATDITTVSSANKVPNQTTQPEQIKSSEQSLPYSPHVNVFRNPSSVTSSSAGESTTDPNSNVAYAQVVFPPDKRKKVNGTSSPKRMAVRSDVPLHILSAQDVRAQLGNLKSFQSVDESEPKSGATAPLTLSTKAATTQPIETDLDDIRPKSPETDF